MSEKESFSFWSHCIAAIISFIATVVLVVITKGDLSNRLIAMIYGLSVVFLFTSSSLYHAFKKEENGKGALRRLDHFAIYVMIAGSYTQISWLYLPNPWFTIIVSSQWAMVLAGVYFKFFRMNTPRIVSTLIYLAMGWMVVIPIGQIIKAIPPLQLRLLVAGGIAYSIGAVFYMLKRPVIIKDRFGFHEIFHLFIVAGALFHFAIAFTVQLA